MNRALISFCCIILLLYVTGFSCQIGAQESKSAQEDDIREAVLRFQMQNWIRDAEKDIAEASDSADKEIAENLNFKVFFISINEKDPSHEFLGRFPDIPRSLKKASASETDEKHRFKVLDKETHQFGIIFSADRIRWLRRDLVEVEGGYYCDGLCAADITFRLRLLNGKWTIKRKRINSVS